MVNLTSFVDIFALPLAIFALLIGFKSEVYPSMQNYADRLEDFVTAQVENANSVTPADVNEWSSTLRAARVYHRSCDAAVYFGYASVFSWFTSMILSRVNLFSISDKSLPIVNSTIATMATIFSLGLFSAFIFTVGSLLYIDHSRAPASSLESQSDAQTETDNF